VRGRERFRGFGETAFDRGGIGAGEAFEKEEEEGAVDCTEAIDGGC